MIQVQGLTKDYGPHRAISDISFTVNKGDVVGFLGPNGAGKSTTMKIITGFMAPSSGVAQISGIDVFENPLEVKKRIGYLPETPPVYGDMFVRDYLVYVAQLKKVEVDKIQQQVNYAIEKTNLGQVQNRMIQNLSKGFRQRVGIAQAIVSDPEVLILDEPTVGLDPKQVAEIRDLILSLRGQHTIILSTHILSEVQATCEKVIIINKGQIVAQDTIDNLSKLESGHQRIQIKTLKAVPDLSQILSGLGAIRSIQAGANFHHWVVDVDSQENNIAMVADKIVQSGLGLLELTPQKIGLEDVFLRLTYGKTEV